MNIFAGFFSTISIFLLVTSFGVLFLVKKWVKSQLAKVEEKKKEIQEVLASADLMIEEMNKFSDYMLSNIEEKSEVVCKMIDTIDDRIGANAKKLQKAEKKETKKNKEEPVDIKTIVSISDRGPKDITPKPIQKSNRGNDGIDKRNFLQTSKSIQIMLLAEKGMEETEIAKRLNVGRGEIQLVLGMNKGLRQA